MDGAGRDRSAPGPAERAAGADRELLTDPRIRAVVPPWGGGAGHRPAVAAGLRGGSRRRSRRGSSATPNTSTLLAPADAPSPATATLHAPGLMDTPFRVPSPLLHWLDVATAPGGATLTQGSTEPTTRRRGRTSQADPEVSEQGAPRDPHALARSPGGSRGGQRFADGCSAAALETHLPMLPGTPYGEPRRVRPGRPGIVYLKRSGRRTRSPPHGCCTTYDSRAGSTVRPASLVGRRPSAPRLTRLPSQPRPRCRRPVPATLLSHVPVLYRRGTWDTCPRSSRWSSGAPRRR